MWPLLNAVCRFCAAELFHAARNEIRPPSSTQSAVWPLSEQQISAGDFIPGEIGFRRGVKSECERLVVPVAGDEEAG